MTWAPPLFWTIAVKLRDPKYMVANHTDFKWYT